MEEYLPGICDMSLIDQSRCVFVQFNFHFFRVVGEVLHDLSYVRVIERRDGIRY